VYDALSIELVKDYVPESWIALVQVKSQYYKATAHQCVGTGLSYGDDRGRPLSAKTIELLTFLYSDSDDSSTDSHHHHHHHISSSSSSKSMSTVTDIRVPKDDVERLQLGLTHLCESVLLHEESLRLQRMCRELKKRDHLSTFLRRAYDTAMLAYERAQDQDDFAAETLDPPPILRKSYLVQHSF